MSEPQPQIPDDNEDKPVLEPEVKDELEEINGPEDPFLTEYASMGQNGNDEKVDVTKGFIGDESGENWKPKTKVSAEQIIALTQVRAMSHAFPEIQGIEPLLNGIVQDLEQYAVSHMGMSREQAVEILKSMHTGEMHHAEDGANRLVQALAAPPEKDD